jgi:hypothetical protein
MFSYKIQSNALPKITNVMSMINGTVEAPVSRAVVKEMSALVGDITRAALYNFVDSSARLNKKRLHHVYEWKKTGNRNHRLFYITDPIVGRAYRARTFINLNITFRESKTNVPKTGFPYERSHIFKHKAEKMEKGKPIKIKPKNGEFLIFLNPDLKGKRGRKGKNDFVFSKGVTINYPGGKEAAGGFKETIASFYSVDIQSKLIKDPLIRGLERQWSRSINGTAFNQASGKTIQSVYYKNMTKNKTARDLITYMKQTKYIYKAER